jgi:ubiquinone/menaquinone biosynthesis C-methylase UbiE
MTSGVDTAFTGSVAQFYESYMVPLIFEPYAVDLARRVAHVAPHRVLELAAGTGVVTRQLAVMLDASTELVATDLNPTMIEEAARIGTVRPVEWRQADAMQLPFESASFDAVVCQFGVMFFPDRVAAHRQALRVLKPDGRYIFNVWGELSRNPVTDIVVSAMAARYPQDPPRFLARIPHGYHDETAIRADLAAAGFTSVSIETVTLPSRAASHLYPAIGFCQGTPMRSEIEALAPDDVHAATDAAAAALAAHYGAGAIEAPMQAKIVTASA